MIRAAANLALALGCLALGLHLAREIQSPVAAPEPLRAPRTAVPETVRLPRPPLADFAEITRRPLFRESRRPVPAVATPDTAAPLPDIALQGIVAAGETRRALLSLAGGAVEVLALGAEIGGWRLAAFEDRAVVLERGTRRIVIGIDGPAPGAGAIADAPDPTAPPRPGRAARHDRPPGPPVFQVDEEDEFD